MKEYHSINSVYKRDERGKFILGDWSVPEFGYLQDNPWNWTEKVDGTNIRVMYYCDSINRSHYTPYDGYDHHVPKLEFGGKTNNAQIPAKLVTYLQDTFSLDQMTQVFGPAGQDGKGLDTQVCLYGEGYGAGIQKGGGNYSPEQKFVLFDVKIGDWWLNRDSILDIAAKLGLDVVPLAYDGQTRTLNEAIADIKNGGFKSQWGDFIAEGLVGIPAVPLFNRKGERIITKVKVRDFK